MAIRAPDGANNHDGVDVGDRHPGPVLQEPLCEGLAQTLGRPCDHHHAPLERTFQSRSSQIVKSQDRGENLI